MEFSSLEELKERLKPALRIKEEEFKKNNIDYISIEDIWNYLRDIKWKRSSNLSLSDMVNDILKLDINNLYK